MRDGRTYLPGMGAMTASPGTGRVAVLRAHNGRMLTGIAGHWLPTRHLDAGALHNVALEDLDPFRDCYDWPVTERLSATQWRAWQRKFAGAERILAESLPSYLEVMAESLGAVVPLHASPGREHAATARQAFGSVAIALPKRTDILAELLLHEFQHVKLNVLADLHPMVSSDARPGLLRVPWRTDPRPLAGVLHGAYAFLAMMSFRRVVGPRRYYLRYQSWVLTATESLLASQALTEDGERFVAGIGAAASVGLGESAG
jgi:uncharacterized protein